MRVAVKRRLVTLVAAALHRTILLVAPAIALLARWGQSYLGGFESYHLGISRGGWFTFVVGIGHGGVAVPIPYWLPTLPALAIAFFAVRALVRRNPNSPGLCPRCGYDLRATPDRCPECGAAPAAPAAR
jgi:hypothetical protein